MPPDPLSIRRSSLTTSSNSSRNGSTYRRTTLTINTSRTDSFYVLLLKSEDEVLIQQHQKGRVEDQQLNFVERECKHRCKLWHTKLREKFSYDGLVI